MRTRDKITMGLLLGTAAVWIGWDILLGATHSATESMWIASWVRQANSLALFLGALVAHWCWQSRDPHYEWWPWAVACLGLALGWDALTTTWSVKGAEVQFVHVPGWTRHPGLWLGLGLPVGHFFWPQRYPGRP